MCIFESKTRRKQLIGLFCRNVKTRYGFGDVIAMVRLLNTNCTSSVLANQHVTSDFILHFLLLYVLLLEPMSRALQPLLVSVVFAIPTAACG